uniref:Uncharacterized protein n=1 Tax=Arundo donax TaxID=35708 RepID=A0A0A9FAK3_ARUDO
MDHQEHYNQQDNRGEDDSHQHKYIDGRLDVLRAAGGVGAHDSDQAGRRAHGQRVAPDGRSVQVGVDEEDYEGDGQHEAHRVAVEEGRVPAPEVVEEDGVAGAVPGPVIVPDQEAARWRQPGLVGDGRRQDREEEKPLPPLLHQLLLQSDGSFVVILVVQRQEDDMDDHVDQHGAGEGHGVDGGAHVAAAAGGVGADEAEEVEYHGGLQRVVLVQGLLPDQDDGDQGGHEGDRVAVVERLVPPGVRGQEDRVAGLVAGAGVLPQAARRVQAGLVGDGRCQSGEQQNERASLVQRLILLLMLVTAIANNILLPQTRLSSFSQPSRD